MIRGLADEMPKPEPPRRNDRRGPRLSIVVILPENHTLSPERLQDSLQARAGREVDVLVACAGQPTNLSALQRCVGDAQFLLAPSGTSSEQLRELAMQHASGDIVTLLPGAALPAADVSDRALFKTS